MPIRRPTGRGTGARRIGGSYANVNTPEQIIRKLREADRLLAEGAEIADVARHLEVSEQTYHRWRNQFGGDSATPAGQLRAGRPDHVWALDYQFDVTATVRTIKILHVVDEFTRESLADLVDHSIDADATVACLDQIVGARGRHPTFIRCDNGPELTENALRDWCRFGGTGGAYIEPGSPWENPWVESYGSRMRDELLAIEQLDTLLEAQVLVANWRTEYNTYRPHSGWTDQQGPVTRRRAPCRRATPQRVELNRSAGSTASSLGRSVRSSERTARRLTTSPPSPVEPTIRPCPSLLTGGT
jgi:putative transposase